jgi:type IV pilus assembly protein PilC
MPHYRFQARLSSGQVQAGVLSADNAAAAASILRDQGHHVMQLVPMAGAVGGTDWKAKAVQVLNFTSGPTQHDILDFTTQLAVMIRAGISIRAALDGIADQVANPKFRKVLLAIKADVEAGKQFSEAIVKYPKLFGPLYVNMVRASEMSGSFAKMLDRIAGFISQQLETRKMVIGASIYPGIIGGMATAVTIFLLTFVLPRFEGVFMGREEVLPWPTKFLLGLSEWMVQSWWVMVLGAILAVAGFIGFIHTQAGRFWWDRMKLITPLFKRMFRALYVSRSLQTMGELLNAGVPMLDTLAITGDISGNVHFKRMWRGVYGAVKQGKKVHTQLMRPPGATLLPKSVVQMIAAGEESGRLGEVLEEISEFYAKALRDAIKAVTSMIEPLMIVLMGSIVGFIAMAIILPIFKMSAIVSG